MADNAQATDTSTQAANGAATDDLLSDAAPADKTDATTTDKPGEKPATESKPAEAGKDGAAGDGDLLADDDEGKSPVKADGPADAKKDAAPETYEAFTLPDGVALDETALAKATPILRELGHNQEQAQKLVTLYAEMQQQAAEQQLAGFNQVKKDWQSAIKADGEFGGDKLPQTLGAAKAVLTKFGDKTLLSDLKEWGWANHPGLIKLLARVNAHLSEDTLVQSDAATQPTPKSPAEILWPSMFQKE